MSTAWDDLMTSKRLKSNSKTRMDMQDFKRYLKKKNKKNFVSSPQGGEKFVVTKYTLFTFSQMTVSMKSVSQTMTGTVTSPNFSWLKSKVTQISIQTLEMTSSVFAAYKTNIHVL